MEISVKCSPAYAAAFCVMRYGEAMFVERGAMAAMSAGVRVRPGIGDGSVGRALKRRMFGGEGFFMGLYQAEVDSAWVAVAPAYPGDLAVLRLEEGQGLLVEQGALVAAESTVEVDVRWRGLRTAVLGEGITMLHLGGTGLALIGSYGGMLSFDLADEETMVVDTTHLVGMSDTVQLHLGMAGSATAAVVTGEGFVGTLQGPGRVMIQTRSEDRFGSWLFPERAHQQRQ